MQKHGKKIHMYASELCAAISDDFRNSPEMAAHDLDTYIFTFTKIGMLSPHFSEMRPAFLKFILSLKMFSNISKFQYLGINVYYTIILPSLIKLQH